MAEAEAGQGNAQPNEQEQKPEVAEKPAAKVYPQEEVDRIVSRVRKNAQRDAELRFRREQQPPQEKPKAEEPKEDAAPKREDFETYEDFNRADAAHAARKAAREETAKVKKEEQEKAQREQNEKAASTWKEKIEKAISKHTDFEDVLEDNPDTMELIHGSPMRAFITESDIGPEIVRHLCLNKEEAKRIATLPRYKQGAAIDKIETELLAAGKPADDKGDEEEDKGDEKAGEQESDAERDAKGRFQKEQKAPPAPIEPGTGRSAANSSLPSDKDDPETWRRKELARMRKQQGKT